MLTWRQLLEAKLEESLHKFGSTQVNIPSDSDAAKALEYLRRKVTKSDLAGDGKEIGHNHITVRYGLKSDNVDGIKKYLGSVAPFTVTLGTTIKFKPSEHSDGAAVIVVPVESRKLREVHDALDQHGSFIEPTFKKYRPHVTVAYVKPEVADKYVGLDSARGTELLVASVAISDKEGKVTEVQLGVSSKPARESFMTLVNRRLGETL